MSSAFLHGLYPLPVGEICALEVQIGGVLHPVHAHVLRPATREEWVSYAADQGWKVYADLPDGPYYYEVQVD